MFLHLHFGQLMEYMDLNVEYEGWTFHCRPCQNRENREKEFSEDQTEERYCARTLQVSSYSFMDFQYLDTYIV